MEAIKANSTTMDVTIKNCRSIDCASISIDRDKLNVKFAPNGTGKSSIAKALAAAGNGINDTNHLIPFKWLQDGSADVHLFCVSGLNGIASVEVFNEGYVQSVVFQQDSLFPHSFDAFVRTPEFLETERELEMQLRSLIELREREEVRKLSADLEAFRTSLVGSGLDRNNKPKASSPAVKALRDGNAWEHEDPLLTPFKPILGPSPFKKWAAWHKQGADYFLLMDGACPYCGQAASPAKERITAVGDAFNSTKAGNIEKVMEAVSVGSSYMSEAAAEQLNAIVDSVAPITEQTKAFIGKVAQDAQLIMDSLAKLSSVSSFFDLSKAEDLDARLADCKINIALVDSFDSAKCHDIADRVNVAVDAAMDNTGKLKGLVNRQKTLLAKSLEGKCGEINAFLSSAGYPYTVDIPDPENGKCSVRLVHSCSWEVANSREALSYGEKNAFALVFFAYDCMKKKPDLVILDDPISSFDGAKRYALLNMLFLGGAGEATLKGKTVLLLTHDYGTLFDIEHTHKRAFQPSARSCVLSCVGGKVTETVVGGDDMVLTEALYERLAKSSNCLMVRLAYARKLLEIRGDKGDAYDVVSSLFHHRPNPTRKDGHLMEDVNASRGLSDLEAIVEKSIDYKGLFTVIESPSDMLTLFDAACSNFEKVQLARIATQAQSDNKVLKERMDDSMHVGNGFLYQLDPTKFELVPLQLVDKCREELLTRI